MINNNFQILMLILMAGSVLLTAVCAYALGLASPRYNDDIFLQRAVKLTKKFIIVGGSIYVGYMALFGVMFIVMLFN